MPKAIAPKTTPDPSPATTGAQPWDLQRQQKAGPEIRVEDYGTPWIYSYHPARTHMVDGRLMPLLTEARLVNGVNGVRVFERADGSQRYDYDNLLNGIRRKGGEPIEARHCTAADTPDGQPGYVRTTIVNGRPVFHSAWQVVEIVANRAVLRTVDGYHAWVAALIERGVIPEVHDLIRRDKVEQLQGIADTLSTRPDAASQRAREQMLRDIEAVEAGAVTDAA